MRGINRLVYSLLIPYISCIFRVYFAKLGGSCEGNIHLIDAICIHAVYIKVDTDFNPPYNLVANCLEV